MDFMERQNANRGKRWGDTQAVMELLGIDSPQTLTKWLKYGLPNEDTGQREPLPASRLGRNLRFDLDAVDVWIATRSAQRGSRCDWIANDNDLVRPA